MASQESLKDASARISVALNDMKQDITQQLEKRRIEHDEISKIYKDAAAAGDLRENADYATAEKELAMCNATIMGLSGQLKTIACVDESDYQPIGMIVMYSTFRITSSLGHNLVYKMYPEGVSDLDRQILSVDTPIGKALWCKEVGDTVHIEHRITGQTVKWTIEDIY